MKLTKQEIQKIADLARLNIDSKDLDYYSDELSEVLDYVEQLNSVDTEKISPKIQATVLSNVMREDAQHPELEPVRQDTVKRIMKAIPFTKGSFAKVKSVFTNRD